MTGLMFVADLVQASEWMPTLGPMLLPIRLGPGDHPLPFAGRPVAGATGVRVDAAAVTVDPVRGGRGRDVGVGAAARTAQTEIAVISPEPNAPTRALVIPELVRHDGGALVPITGEDDLGPCRLVVCPMVGGQRQAPVVAVPPLPASGLRPALLTGATLSGGRLTLPDLPGGRFHVSLCTGDTPDDFAPQLLSCGDVHVFVAPAPIGLHVLGPDGAEVFALAGPLTGPSTVDLRAALERDLGWHPETPSTQCTLRVDGVGDATVQHSAAFLIERAVSERLSVTVAGQPAVLELPTPDPGRSPLRTRGTITIVHEGLELHPISDPPPTGVPEGPVVRDIAVTRDLPAEALAGLRVRRIAVWGRALTECDLTLEVLGRSATREGIAATATPGGAEAIWFDLAADVLVDAPVRVSLRATRGAFGWAADLDPRVQVAVAVDPAGRSVTVDGRRLQLTGPRTVLAVELGTPPWRVETDQFCTVELAGAVLEFEP